MNFIGSFDFCGKGGVSVSLVISAMRKNEKDGVRRGKKK